MASTPASSTAYRLATWIFCPRRWQAPVAREPRTHVACRRFPPTRASGLGATSCRLTRRSTRTRLGGPSPASRAPVTWHVRPMNDVERDALVDAYIERYAK